MELEEAITSLKATIEEFKYLQSTLDEYERELYEHGVQEKEINAIETVLQEFNKLQKENKNLKSYLSKQGLVNDYIRFVKKVK